jgi:flavorubredoxin
MTTTVLYKDKQHRNILFEEQDPGGFAVQSNQHMIVHGDAAMLLDPGGHKIYAKLLAQTFAVLGRARLTHIFLSHQDPDIVAALNGWLMTTDATAHISVLWTRFVPHFGLDRLVADRLQSIPDEGAVFDLDGAELYALPAHFLHSEGNFQLYDPTAKILYSGDLGASIGAPYDVVPDFDAHLPHIEGFHRRYMVSRKVMRAWADMARGLEIETIAPQHGAVFKGKETVARFIDWCSDLECGVDLMPAVYAVPKRASAASLSSPPSAA